MVIVAVFNPADVGVNKTFHDASEEGVSATGKAPTVNMEALVPVIAAENPARVSKPMLARVKPRVDCTPTGEAGAVVKAEAGVLLMIT